LRPRANSSPSSQPEDSEIPLVIFVIRASECSKVVFVLSVQGLQSIPRRLLPFLTPFAPRLLRSLRKTTEPPGHQVRSLHPRHFHRHLQGLVSHVVRLLTLYGCLKFRPFLLQLTFEMFATVSIFLQFLSLAFSRTWASSSAFRSRCASSPAASLFFRFASCSSKLIIRLNSSSKNLARFLSVPNRS